MGSDPFWLKAVYALNVWQGRVPSQDVVGRVPPQRVWWDSPRRCSTCRGRYSTSWDAFNMRFPTHVKEQRFALLTNDNRILCDYIHTYTDLMVFSGESIYLSTSLGDDHRTSCSVMSRHDDAWRCMTYDDVVQWHCSTLFKKSGVNGFKISTAFLLRLSDSHHHFPTNSTTLPSLLLRLVGVSARRRSIFGAQRQGGSTAVSRVSRLGSTDWSRVWLNTVGEAVLLGHFLEWV